MATKAELEAELKTLRRALKQSRDEAGSTGTADVSSNDEDQATQATQADGLQQLLDEHGINAETLDAFKSNLIAELTELQKEKPLVVLAATLALGIIIGRAFK